MREKMETGRTRKLEWGVGADMSFLQGHFMILMSSQTFGERKKNKKKQCPLLKIFTVAF